MFIDLNQTDYEFERRGIISCHLCVHKSTTCTISTDKALNKNVVILQLFSLYLFFFFFFFYKIHKNKVYLINKFNFFNLIYYGKRCIEKGSFDNIYIYIYIKSKPNLIYDFQR
jgi:hypothetical protein